MWTGTVVSLHISPAAAGEMVSVSAVRAVPGRGLEGDRYYAQSGTYSKKPNPDREVTLIESEAIDALRRDYNIEVEPGMCRRNIVTQGVALNHFIGRDFQVGEVVLRGLRLCEPCGHMEELAERPVRQGLIHRGGLRAQILTGGTIRTGDPIEPR
jgi:MOSC domain-containing protein YiiM